MAIRSRVMGRKWLVVAVVRGSLSMSDLRANRARLASHPDYHPRLRQLFDLRRATEILVSPSELREFADFGHPGAPRFTRVAIVVNGDLAYGLSRIYQTYNARHTYSTLKIFREGGEALTWLLTQ